MQGMVVSVTVGKVQSMQAAGLAADGRPMDWRSGIFKKATGGAVRVTKSGIEGDEQADLKHHGGPDNVVLAYAAGHYPVWRRDLELPELAYGSFGENVTMDGDFADETVCVGDVWKIGEVTLQVTQPRQPCWKLARRLGRPGVVKLAMGRGWGGWYSRVLVEGVIEVGMRAELVERKHAAWPVARAVSVMYARKKRAEEARELAGLVELSARWKNELVEA